MWPSRRSRSTLSYVPAWRYHPADSPAIVLEAPLRDTIIGEYTKADRSIQVAIKIATASGKSFPSLATGSLVGMEKNGVLEITNSFPFPDVTAAQTDGQNDTIANLSAAAPRAKQNIAYGNEMIKFLREVNVDANNVGWYTSTSMGNFVNLNTIENQFYYQNQLNERTVALIYDVSRSSEGTLNLRAYRLSPQFVTAYKEGKFTTERYASSTLVA